MTIRDDAAGSAPPPAQAAPKKSDRRRRLGCYGCGCLSLLLLVLFILNTFYVPRSYRTGAPDGGMGTDLTTSAPSP